ncbi:threonylcarbamoyl-AMP synthase [Clostridium bornimense]|uniref:L-threonylcarbamoyladenylate synthase n=1 Tax=Clostridium bornimense TaxID=1216932 RepID=UPI001C10D105|nr:L-threonylcarbamoyladenylate synthase [Clostridium bornimense]MBU5314947.1 threonylcarbamoyl-AMP synthase [Clostridium bornimense]
MDTKVIILDENNIDEKLIKSAGDAIKDGKLVAFPTETVYGLGANALDEEAVKNIYIAKGRPSDNPLIVHISKVEDVNLVAREVPTVAKKIMDKYWPGPITIILPKREEIPYATSGGLDSVGVRLPSEEIARKLIDAATVPVAAPSANLSGKPSPTNVERVIEDLEGRVDYIIGGKSSVIGLESTVIDCTVYPPCILRPGAITLEELKNIDKDIYMDKGIESNGSNSGIKPKAPGMKYRHYAPKAPVKIVSGNEDKVIKEISSILEKEEKLGKKVGIIATDETISKYNAAIIISLGSRNNLYEIGQNIFESLRKLDDLEVDMIICEGIEEKGYGVAIMNRLKKAATFDIIEVY